MAEQHFLKLMKKHLKDYSITGELYSDSYCSNYVCNYQNVNYIITVINLNPNGRNSTSLETQTALTRFTERSDFLIKNRYTVNSSTDLFSISYIEPYKMGKKEYFVRKIEEARLFELAASRTQITPAGEEPKTDWVPPVTPPPPVVEDRKPLIHIPTWAAAAVLIAVIGFGVYKFAGEQPASYTDSHDSSVQALSKGDMEDAYTLGMQYYEQGNYENAIAELNKVTKKSGKYEEAQAAMVAAMAAYRDELIEKSEEYCASGNFEMALSLLESGTALLGNNNDLLAQQKNVLNQLKVDHIKKSSDAEQSGDYATAFSYVQTALAFLPNDIELEGLYSRLEAMTIMTTALQDAENYAAMEDYAKLFSSLEEAMDDVRDSTTASSKIKLAYDEYKKSFLNDIEEQIKNPTTVDEYSRAIDALGVAVEIFPDEYELKRKQESLQLMKVALDAIVKADEHRANNDYAKMFVTLSEAQSSVRSDEAAYDKVTKIYDEYKNEYLADIFARIGEPQSVDEYDKAIKILEEEVAVLPQEQDLMELLNQYKNNKPVYLMIECPPYQYNTDLYSEFIDSNSFMMANESYTNGFQLGENIYDDAWVFFNLGGEYNRLEFDVGHVDKYRMDDRTMNLYLDGKLELTMTLEAEAMVQHISIDLDGAKQLKIEMIGGSFSGSGYGRARYGWANLTLYK